MFGFWYKDLANPVAYGSDYELPDDLRIDPRETLLSGSQINPRGPGADRRRAGERARPARLERRR